MLDAGLHHPVLADHTSHWLLGMSLKSQPHHQAKTNIRSMQECIDEKQPLP
jgi:hypothetical protein